MRGPIHEYLARDHARLGALLEGDAYPEFRAGLLRHIAMEEKVLFADSRARRGGEPLPIVTQLHADHAALASLLVPPPTPALLRTIRDLLAEHDPLEEDEGGLYDLCDQLAGPDALELVTRMRAIPEVRASQHLDEPRIHEHIARMLAARART